MLYIPRRHRRKLLLPPGLLALAFLLLVGCGVLGSRPKIHRYSMMPLDLPSYKLCGDNSFALFNREEMIYSPCLTSIEVKQLRSWQTIELTGRAWEDYFLLRQVEASIERLMLGTNQEAGLCLILDKASYRILVDLLDLFATHNLDRSWLDVGRKTTALYAFANDANREPFHGNIPPCGGLYIEQPTRSLTTYEGIIASFYEYETKKNLAQILLFSSLSILLILITAKRLLYNQS